MSTAAKNRKRRGSALSMMIIVSVIVTGLVMTMAWSAGMQSNLVGGYSRVDGAFYAAESGAQRVAWFCKNKKMAAINSPLTGTINGYNYSTSWQTVSGSTIRINSVGSVGSVSSSCYLTVTPPTPPPATFSFGGDFDGKNFSITGDVQTKGNYTSGGGGSIHGNLKYAGTASNLDSVTGGTPTQDTNPPSLALSQIENNLYAARGAQYLTDQNGTTFNFDLVPGPVGKKVIYVEGNVTNAHFSGAGTLYVKGTYSSGDFGSAPSPSMPGGVPVNIVATGDITTDNNSTIYGSLYTDGNWNRGKIDITGSVYVTKDINSTNDGHSTMTQSDPPWFDPRSPGGSAAAAQFSNFAGPQP
jgi:hypothetical protein